MTAELLPLWLVLLCALGAVGLFVLLTGSRRGRVVGAAIGGLAACGVLLLLARSLPEPDPETSVGLISRSLGWLLAALGIGGAGGTIVCRDPTQAFRCFLGTALAAAGLLLLSGESFVGLTLVLFVAAASVPCRTLLSRSVQDAPEPSALREPWLACVAGGLLAAGLFASVQWTLAVESTPSTPQVPHSVRARVASYASVRSPELSAPADVSPDGNVASLAGVLMGRHLVSVAVLGALLLLSLVGPVLLQRRAAPAREQAAP